ncbi:DNA alkylation repair protein [Mucilaginibacter sp. L3T2-6]|uniref:DNA alkylation repair protein n=1 Tax=Mucilaginibacter sp. L3T2-6 TaxID=3062491 RepID=UPI0026748247|nr:DNA alkylation repair protein [Mucilaginibacter sp. L3T2-6]MDO3644291.1 DNA alkylation repair protein [Mucilaginibacter sp. L3T2-6]MDV6216742.1 DNA alkylation repair protein [Mucilaginibacter sp. L3T2-6]
MTTADEIIDILKEKSNEKYKAGMKRFGIVDEFALGIRLPELRKIAKLIKSDHSLALDLWKTKIHEARLLASMIADPKQLTEAQADSWVHDFYSWDVCDQVCGNLLDKTPFAIDKARQYSRSENEFVKRAGFVLMAELAVHDKKAPNEVFRPFFAIIESEAWDGRNFVKKAVNWALRQIGKRNADLRTEAMDTARRILAQNTKSARWIATDALNELSGK